MNKNAAGRYASVNGLKMYYEIHGAGEPLVMLHGGVGASEMFGPILPVLAERRQVIAVHLQAHGRTADIDRPLRFELMAEDIAALVKQLGIERADVMGYSLGGGVALRTAIQHPKWCADSCSSLRPSNTMDGTPRSRPPLRRWVPN